MDKCPISILFLAMQIIVVVIDPDIIEGYNKDIAIFSPVNRFAHQ